MNFSIYSSRKPHFPSDDTGLNSRSKVMWDKIIIMVRKEGIKMIRKEDRGKIRSKTPPDIILEAIKAVENI